MNSGQRSFLKKIYFKLYARLAIEMRPQPGAVLKIKIIYATTIYLCAAGFPWAKFRSRKGAIKVHTHRAYRVAAPMCPVTDRKTHDCQAIQDLRFKWGDLLIFGRAYMAYAWFFRLQHGNVCFVTCLKRKAR